MTELEEIQSYKDQIQSARDNLEAYIKRRWPVGSDISWIKNGGLQRGKVQYVYEDRVKVLNDDSGAVYWIDLYWIEKALQSEFA